MRHYHWSRSLAANNIRAVTLIGIAVILAGCGPASEDQELLEGSATISGVVHFTGEAPEPEPISMEWEAVCHEQYPDGLFTETVSVNDNGTLQNVFLYIGEGLPDQEWPIPTDPILLDQVGCRYLPHVLGVQAGQELVIRNSDGVLHNVRITTENNRPFNLAQPKEMDTIKAFAESEVMISVECDVHPWMLGYIGVLDHPFFSVTGEEGSFEIKGLPAGEYVIEAWHELFGTQQLAVSVDAGDFQEIEFTFEGD